MSRTTITAVAVLISASLMADEALAQYRRYQRRPLRNRYLAGASFNVGVPRGEFGDFVDESPGLSGFFVANFDRQGIFGLRLDAGALIYGSETVRVPLTPTIRRVFVEVETENEILSFFLGPQLTAPPGPIRPFLNAGVGLSWFGTVSNVRGLDSAHDFARTVNFDDLTPALMGGGGMLIMLSRKFGLSLSGQYIHNGRVSYLTEGGIEELPDGDLLLFPIESDTNLFLVQFGVAFAF